MAVCQPMVSVNNKGSGFIAGAYLIDKCIKRQLSKSL